MSYSPTLFQRPGTSSTIWVISWFIQNSPGKPWALWMTYDFLNLAHCPRHRKQSFAFSCQFPNNACYESQPDVSHSVNVSEILIMILTASSFLVFAAHLMQHAAPSITEMYRAPLPLVAKHQACSKCARPPGRGCSAEFGHGAQQSWD